MEHFFDFGPCCACEGTENVRNIVALNKRASVPGTGWGCFVCHIQSDGAHAVICDRCVEAKTEIRFAVYGYITDKQRIKIDELTQPFGHDMRYHQDELEISDTYEDFDGEHGNWLAEDDCN